MANTTQKHKEKKSQKRKERQLRRKQKQDAKNASQMKFDAFLLNSIKTMKGTSKSLPGFLAKHVDMICRWLKEYCALFQKADDACIDYLKLMERDKRNQLVQDYVDIHVFIELVDMLKKKINIDEENNDINQTTDLSCISS